MDRRVSSSFRLANDEPIVFQNYKAASSVANVKLKLDLDSEKDVDKILDDIVCKKRRIYDEKLPQKRVKHQSTPLSRSPKKSPQKHNYKSNDTPSTSGPQTSSKFDSDDIDWSDDGEFFKNVNSTVSLIEEQKTPISKESKVNKTQTTTVDTNNRETLANDHDSGTVDDDELEWSDCDNELNTSIARLDRSALQEISNLSSRDEP